MFATGVTMGLAEWIIDDTFLVNFISTHLSHIEHRKRYKRYFSLKCQFF